MAKRRFGKVPVLPSPATRAGGFIGVPDRAPAGAAASLRSAVAAREPE